SKPAWRTPTTPSVADRQPIGKTKRTTAACAPRMAPLIDESTEFGARVARRLRDETVVRLTTVTPSGAPLPRPAGFLWDSGTNVFIHNQPGARIHNPAQPEGRAELRRRRPGRRHRRLVRNSRGGRI